MSKEEKSETIEQFLARGGRIQKIDPEPIETPVTKPKIKGWQKSVSRTKGKFK